MSGIANVLGVIVVPSYVNASKLRLVTNIVRDITARQSTTQEQRTTRLWLEGAVVEHAESTASMPLRAAKRYFCPVLTGLLDTFPMWCLFWDIRSGERGGEEHLSARRDGRKNGPYINT